MKISQVAALALVLLSPPVFAGVALPPPPSLVMVPYDAQTGVPIDVEPLIQGWPLQSDDLGSVQVALRSDQDEDVQLTVDVDSEKSAIVIRPTSELATNTSYEVTVTFDTGLSAPDVLTSSFSTGAGPLEAAPQPASAVVQHWWSPSGGSEDWAGEGTCIGLESDDLVEVQPTMMVDVAAGISFIPPGFYTGAFNANAIDGAAYVPPCVQLRRRALNGTFSDPTVTCGSFAPIYLADGAVAASACSETGMTGVQTRDSYRQPPPLPPPPADLSDAQSCSIHHSASSSSPSADALLALTLGVTLRRRRARRSTLR